MTVENLVTFYNFSTSADREQAAWYWIARAECIKRAAYLRIPVQRFIYAVAALSPGLVWEANIEAAFELASTGKTNWGYRVNRVKAWQCLQGDLAALKGPKVTRFAKSILNPNRHANEVVVDRWAWRAWAGILKGEKSLSIKEYHAIASDYREAARLVGERPGEFQAIVWTVVRRMGKKHGQLALDI